MECHIDRPTNTTPRYNQLLRIEEALGDKALFAGGKGLSKGVTAPQLHSE